jgi:hypothetical protein
MPEHTPGPWTVGKQNIANVDGWKLNRFPISGNGQAIASVWAGRPGRIPFGNEEANAHLIAAAPDLLTAARLAGNRTADLERKPGEDMTAWAARLFQRLKDIRALCADAVAKTEPRS